MLIDFGSGHFQGAPRLTWQSLPPGTPAYLSAQACLFHIRSVRDREGYYPPSPADDLFALGVTAYRLVMGEYPPPMEPHEDEEGGWRVTSPDPRPLLENNLRVEPRLREWILRLLSDSPEARGTAAQAAEALEAMADEKDPALQPASRPAAEVSPPDAPVPAAAREPPERPRPPACTWDWKPWLALAAAGVSAVLLWSSRQPVLVPPGHLSTSTQQPADSEVPDAGSAAVGDTSPTAPPASAPPPAEKKPVAQEPPPEPRPGQMRPDEKGRCPGRKQVLINGGCWVEQSAMTPEECTENGFVRYKGRCYTHALAPPQKPVPTSSPAKER